MAGKGNTKISITSVNKGNCTSRQCEVECNTGYLAKSDTCVWAKSCSSPCGHGTINHGNTDTCYSAGYVDCTSTCPTPVTATCNDGSWSVAGFGTTYTHAACTYLSCECTITVATTVTNSTHVQNYTQCGSYPILSAVLSGVGCGNPGSPGSNCAIIISP